jgi:hypothetical protein
MMRTGIDHTPAWDAQKQIIHRQRLCINTNLPTAPWLPTLAARDTRRRRPGLRRWLPGAVHEAWHNKNLGRKIRDGDMALYHSCMPGFQLFHGITAAWFDQAFSTDALWEKQGCGRCPEGGEWGLKHLPYLYLMLAHSEGSQRLRKIPAHGHIGITGAHVLVNKIRDWLGKVEGFQLVGRLTHSASDPWAGLILQRGITQARVWRTSSVKAFATAWWRSTLTGKVRADRCASL